VDECRAGLAATTLEAGVNPRIVFSPLSKRWYVATAYREKHGIATDGTPTAYLSVTRKYDVTDQMEQILRTTPRKRKHRAR